MADHPSLKAIMEEYAGDRGLFSVWDRTKHDWVDTHWYLQIAGALKADRVFLCRREGVHYCEDLEKFVMMAKAQRITKPESSTARVLRD